MNDLILYTTEDGRSQIELRADLGTVWLSQLDMAELFQTSKQNVAKHLKAIFGEQELSADAVVDQRLATAADGKNYRVAHYNLDAILAVGYRVRSPRGVQFRRWASTVLKEYLAKGFVMDDERLKNPDGRPDYFDEMLARIRSPTRHARPATTTRPAGCDLSGNSRAAHQAPRRNPHGLLAPERGTDHHQQRLSGAHPRGHGQPCADGKQHRRAVPGRRPTPQNERSCTGRPGR